MGIDGIKKIMDIYNNSNCASKFDTVFRKLAIYIIIIFSKNISYCYHIICQMLNTNPFSGILILNTFPQSLKTDIIKNSSNNLQGLLEEIKKSKIKEEKEFWNFPEFHYNRKENWQTKILNLDVENSRLYHLEIYQV